MFKQINIQNILFLDIETVPVYPDYKSMPERFQKLWDMKAQRLMKSESDTPDQIYEKAGIYAEFGKIVCISVAYFHNQELRINSYYGEKEKILLEEFSELLNKYFNSKQHLLCAHNGKEFDYPYIARRLLINGLDLPPILNIAGKKPWQVQHLDTLELCRFNF